MGKNALKTFLGALAAVKTNGGDQETRHLLGELPSMFMWASRVVLVLGQHGSTDVDASSAGGIESTYDNVRKLFLFTGEIAVFVTRFCEFSSASGLPQL